MKLYQLFPFLFIFWVRYCDLEGSSKTYGHSVGRSKPWYIDEGYECNIPLKADGTRDYSLQPSHTISLGKGVGTALETHIYKSHTYIITFTELFNVLF